MSPEPKGARKKRPGSLAPAGSEQPAYERPEDVGMRPEPTRARPRGPEEDPRFQADLESQDVALGSGDYPLTSTEGRITGERGARNLDHVGSAKGLAEEEEEETEEAESR